MMNKKEIVYVLFNESWPCYKIGRTTNLEQRLISYKTHSPNETLPILLLKGWKSKNLESKLKRIFRKQKHPYSSGTEWFSLDIDDFKIILKESRAMNYSVEYIAPFIEWMHHDNELVQYARDHDMIHDEDGIQDILSFERWCLCTILDVYYENHYVDLAHLHMYNKNYASHLMKDNIIKELYQRFPTHREFNSLITDIDTARELIQYMFSEDYSKIMVNDGIVEFYTNLSLDERDYEDVLEHELVCDDE